MSSANLAGRIFNITVVVAALGYFVDIYDLTLFNIVRVPSLKSLGFSGDELLSEGKFLLNMQMLGMLIGGILWGIWGDKKGRLSVLFFTILIYSLANIANAFVTNIEQYAAMRLIAGLGLAGELGVGITLVSEIMTKENRGYGTSMVGVIGILGAVLGYAITASFSWKMAYMVGGIQGLVLLVLRIYVTESGMFRKAQTEKVNRGNIMMLFTSKKRFLKYLYCILLGIPVWYIVGYLISFSDDFAGNVLHIKGTVIAGRSVMFHYIGASLGSLLWGLVGQWLQSRKKSLWMAFTLLIIFTAAYFFAFGLSSGIFYAIVFFLGIAQGYWIIFVTVASEQFGTNLRATVTTTAPNFVRGSVIGITSLITFLTPMYGKWDAAIFTGILCISLALFSLYKLDETYGKDLDYMES
ncbi:MAG: MFS transporter [Bacteroidia bacterium]